MLFRSPMFLPEEMTMKVILEDLSELCISKLGKTTGTLFFDYVKNTLYNVTLDQFLNDDNELSHTKDKLKLMKKAPRKVYVVDNGFVTSKAFSLSDNLGRLLENQVFIELVRRGYDVERTMFYYRSRNDKEVDFVLRKEAHIERLVQVCYDMRNPKTEKREVDSIVECAGELKCDNLVIVTNNDKRTIEKDGYKIDVVPISEF